MDLMMITGVETSVMDSGSPVNVAINPGREETLEKDAVPPVQTAASKTNMVKLLLKQETQKSPFFINSYANGDLSTKPCWL